IVREYWRHMLSKLIDNGIFHGAKHSGTPCKVFIAPEVSRDRFLLKISNFLHADNFIKDVERVNRGLKNGLPNERKEGVDESEGHGFGLLEIYNCCQILQIQVEVVLNESDKKLTICLDGSHMICKDDF